MLLSCNERSSVKLQLNALGGQAPRGRFGVARDTGRASAGALCGGGKHRRSPPEPPRGSRRQRRKQSPNALQRKKAECATCGERKASTGLPLWVGEWAGSEEVGGDVSSADCTTDSVLGATHSLQVIVTTGLLPPGRGEPPVRPSKGLHPGPSEPSVLAQLQHFSTSRGESGLQRSP